MLRNVCAGDCIPEPRKPSRLLFQSFRISIARSAKRKDGESMAIYHFSAQVIGRSSGKSVVASAAYRSGENMYDEHTGLAFDYTRKQNIDHTEILAPGQSPAWVQDREKLWNQVELIERRKDAQLARELNVAIPKELNKEQQIELIRNFTKDQFISKGMVADIALHNLAGENPHAHIMLTTREIGPDGFGKKNREWNDRELHKEWRKGWADQANQALERAGSQERIDHRSLEDQGVQRTPQIHVGPHAAAMEKRGIQTERGDQNRKIIDLNEARERHNKQVAEYKRDLKQIQEEINATKHTKPIQEQLKTLEQAKAEYHQAYDDMSKQRQVVSNLKLDLNNAIAKLNEYDQLDREIEKVNKNIEKVNRFNPFKRNEIKGLEKERDILIRQKQIAFGNTSWDSLADKVTKLSKIIEPEKKKLTKLEEKHDQARKGFEMINPKMHVMNKPVQQFTKNKPVQQLGHPLNKMANAVGNSLKQVKQKEEFEADRDKAKLERKMQTKIRSIEQEDELEL